MALEESAQELDTPAVVSEEPEQSTQNIQPGEDVNPSGQQPAEEKTEIPESKQDDKTRFAFQKERCRRKEAERKYKALQQKYSELENTLTGRSISENIPTQMKMAMLQQKMEDLADEDNIAQRNFQDELKKMRIGAYYEGNELEDYNSSIAPQIDKAIAKLNELNPLVARYVEQSNAMPLFIKAFINKDGMNLFNRVNKDNQIETLRELVKLEDELVGNRTKERTPVVIENTPVPITKSVNNPKPAGSDKMSYAEIRKIFG